MLYIYFFNYKTKLNIKKGKVIEKKIQKQYKHEIFIKLIFFSLFFFFRIKKDKWLSNIFIFLILKKKNICETRKIKIEKKKKRRNKIQETVMTEP